jgi:signal transduction histidine kinase
VATAASKGEGWIDYEWVNPASKKVEPKSTYVERVPGENLFVGVGIYR